jgi:two-component system, NarL family, nitrate/nitrite response regulator NarL
LATGNSNESIAERLVIGVGTVKNHVHNVLKKLKLRSRKDASTYLSFVQRRASTPQVAYAH